VLVEAHGGGCAGIGYTYGDAATGVLVRDTLAPVVEGRDALDVRPTTERLRHACRNLGRPGIGAMAIAAIDTALWDLKARLLGLPLVTLLDAVHDSVPVYGSGGFTSLTNDALGAQLAGWVEDGIPRVKMKVGREPQRDLERVAAARAAIGDEAELYVDANGAFDRRRELGLELAGRFASDLGVTWFEEPVSSDDLAGLRFMRERTPTGMEIAAGEYGYTLASFWRLLEAEAVDCVQADVTRCEGITGFLEVAVLCEAQHVAFSAHCAPALHLHACCAARPLRHLEWFHDHVRIERLLFDGTIDPSDGALHPDLSRPGNGLEIKRREVERHAS
jgi:L-alanine-DL-glutamate epimerase-like enolase superfamily enzyme